MPGWMQGICIVILFFTVRRMFNRKPKGPKKPRRRTIESITRKMKVRVDDKSAYCLLCHCVVQAKEAEPEGVRGKAPSSKSAYQKALEASGVEQWDTSPQFESSSKELLKRKRRNETDYSE